MSKRVKELQTELSRLEDARHNTDWLDRIKLKLGKIGVVVIETRTGQYKLSTHAGVDVGEGTYTLDELGEATEVRKFK